MKNSVVILPLGTLLDEVNVLNFQIKIMGQTLKEHSGVQPSEDQINKGLYLCDQFNRGKDPEEFKKEFLATLDIQNLSDSEFWTMWNSMIKVGAPVDKLELLNSFSADNNALFYLHSDTNLIQAQFIQNELKQQNISFDLSKKPALLKEIPVEMSYQWKLSRLDLVKSIVDKIRNKSFRIPDEITLVIGDAKNIQSEEFKKQVAIKNAALIIWCEQNNVIVKIHTGDLKQTLTEVFHPEEELSQTREFRQAR